MFIKKIFLTGEIQVGKSTIIQRFIESHSQQFKAIAGFKSKGLYKDQALLGYYLEDQLKPNDDFSFIGINNSYPFARKCVGVTETFDTRGVTILNQVFSVPVDLVVLDECGFFEIDALLFQEKVKEILDSELRVIGVIKNRTNSFLETIKQHKDVIVIEVTRENRESIKNKIDEIWSDVHEN